MVGTRIRWGEGPGQRRGQGRGEKPRMGWLLTAF